MSRVFLVATISLREKVLLELEIFPKSYFSLRHCNLESGISLSDQTKSHSGARDLAQVMTQMTFVDMLSKVTVFATCSLGSNDFPATGKYFVRTISPRETFFLELEIPPKPSFSLTNVTLSHAFLSWTR